MKITKEMIIKELKGRQIKLSRLDSTDATCIDVDYFMFNDMHTLYTPGISVVRMTPGHGNIGSIHTVEFTKNKKAIYTDKGDSMDTYRFIPLSWFKRPNTKPDWL